MNINNFFKNLIENSVIKLILILIISLGIDFIITSSYYDNKINASLNDNDKVIEKLISDRYKMYEMHDVQQREIDNLQEKLQKLEAMISRKF